MIMNFIQALYDPRQPFPAEPKHYMQILEDIAYFGIGAQIYHRLIQREMLETTPLYFQHRLKDMYHETLLRNVWIKHESDKILNALENAGVQVILLKGVRFAEKYFGHIGARGTSDIDLLLRADDVERAIACVQSLRFIDEGVRIPAHFHRSFAKDVPNSPLPLTVELHWSFLTEKTSRLTIEPFWSDATTIPPFSRVMELSDYHTFYMICLHGWKHAMDSLKYFLDIIQMVQTLKNRIDYKALFSDAASHSTYKRMIHTLSIVYGQFPFLHQANPFPFQQKTGNWWDYNTIRHSKDRHPLRYIRFARQQWFDYDTPLHAISASYQYLQSMVRFSCHSGKGGEKR